MMKVAVLEVGSVERLAASWLRSLRSERKADKTLLSYNAAVAQFGAFLEETGMPTVVASISREHVESFIDWLLTTPAPNGKPRSASTAATRFRGLQQFFRWLVEDGEIAVSPMVNMRPPQLDEDEVQVLPDEDIRKVLATCRGRSFEDRRDEAILRLFLGCGLRLGELTHLEIGDVDLNDGTVHIRSETAKRNRERTVAMGASTERAVDRYMERARPEHGMARNTDRLWVGNKGALTDSGVVQLIRRRSKRAGLDYLIHPHAMRHTAAHKHKSRGTSDDDLMYMFGWSSVQMLHRYGRSAQGSRARAVARRWSPDDEF